VGDGFRLLRAGQRRPAMVAGLLLGAAAIYGVVRPATLPEPREGPLVASIQPGFPQELKMRPMAARQRFDFSVKQSQALLAAEPPPDVLVWPETMWPWLIGEGRTADSEQAWAPLVASGRVQLVIGALWVHASVPERFSNSALLIDPQGRVTHRYDKEFLVPGGEAVPFGELMPAGFKSMVEGWIAASAGFVVDLLPGDTHEPLSVGGHPCGVTICFENAYGEPSRESVGAGAAFLLNLSNEAWFGSSAEHDHMELQSVLRAVETRRALFRSTNSGITCLVRPDGRKPDGDDRLVVGGADRAVAGTFVARVPLYDGLTPYVRWGEWIGWVALLASVIYLLRFRPQRLP
jgi:apolipoprotein N-acyltransferase